jgi:hypothetical protein
VEAVSFPFKAPDDDLKRFSLDRFFLLRGMPLFFILVLVAAVVGILFALPMADRFFGMMMFGFLIALLAEKYVFPTSNYGLTEDNPRITLEVSTDVKSRETRQDTGTHSAVMRIDCVILKPHVE